MLYDIDLADETFRAMSRDECIRATIPRKPQRPSLIPHPFGKCIRATIPRKPQLSPTLRQPRCQCIRATIPRKPQHPCRKVAS